MNDGVVCHHPLGVVEALHRGGVNVIAETEHADRRVKVPAPLRMVAGEEIESPAHADGCRAYAEARLAGW